MKAITIMQPFATLIALGEKHFETRSWSTKYRGDLLIHVGKGTDYLDFCYQEPFKSILKHYGYNYMSDLPMGKIIAKTVLKDCIQVKESNVCISPTAILTDNTTIKNHEFTFGDYTEGRYAWRLDNVKLLKNPISAKGQQRIWNYKGDVWNEL